jgi:uncharacterized protein with beta-barrel porin domain
MLAARALVLATAFPTFPKKTLAALLPLALASFCVPAQAQFAVGTGTTDTAAKTLTTGQTGSVASGGALSVNGLAVNITGTSGTVTINNAGTISSTNSTARAIDNNTSGVTINLTNTGTISSLLGDAFRINKAGSVIILNNLGTIISGGTFPVNNALPGGIDGSNAGQALDFRAITSTGNIINNGDASHTGALIQSNTEDAIRPGANTTINNYGTIITNSPVNTKDASGTHANISAADGIDAGGNLGVVVNNYGSISGSRHGITADTNITVTNYASGTITGRNGSGVGSDGNGTVVNYGLISGDYAGAGKVFTGNDPTGLNGDGDGVDIDGVANITNYGTIRGTGAGGVDSGGLPNGAEGIAAGGGTIVNNAGALVSGASVGILVDNGANGPGVAATTITNAGTIEGKSKAAIGLVGTFNDTITNTASGVIRGGANAVMVDAVGSTTPGAAIQMGAGNDTLNNAGTIIGGNGLAVDMGAGDDTVNITGGSITGKVDGGSGTNALNFSGSFTGTGDFVNFATTNVNSGTVRLMGQFQSTAAVNVGAGSTFIVDNSFTTGNLTVNGTLGASGAGAPRNITVTGNYTQAATGTLEVGIQNANALDKFAVTGTATLASGASIRPVMLGGAYVQNGQSFTFLTSGTLAANGSQLNVLGSSAVLKFALAQSGNSLVLTAQRSGYETAAGNSGESAVGGALSSAGANGAGGAGTQMGALLGALDAQPTGGAVSGALNQLQPLPGSVVQGASNSLQNGFFRTVDERVASARNGIDSMTGMAAGDTGDARRAWVRVFGNQATQEARGGVDGYRNTGGGIAAGFDKSLDARTLVGMVVGASHADVDRSGALSGSGVDIDSLQVAAYGSRDYGGWYLEGSAGYGYNSYKSTRQVSFTGFAGSARGEFKGHQLSARLGAGWLRPIDDAWAVRWLASGQVTYLRTGSYAETGAAGANLNVDSARGTSVLSSLGGQLERAFGTGATRYTAIAKAAWQHEFGQTMQGSASFAAGGPSFTVAGLTPARDALVLGLGITGTDRKGFSLSAGYEAEIRQQYAGHTIQVKAQWLF